MKKQCQMMIVAAGLVIPAIAQDANDSVQSAPVSVKSAEEQLVNHDGRIAGLEESYADTKSTVDKLKKIKISGYIQAQYRMAINGKDAQTDSAGVYKNAYQYKVGDFSGGAFGNGNDKQFQIRRARVKVAYEGNNSQAVVQFDAVPFTVGSALESVDDTKTKVKQGVTDTTADTTALTFNKKAYMNGGGITVKDAYLRFNEPWLQSIALKAGIYDRPYGFEVGYSSSSRETPERSRMEQTLFPGERDLGVSVEYIPADKLPKVAQMFNLKAGLFTGNGINVENDSKFDAIGRAGVTIPFYNANLQIDGGFSWYRGGLTSHNDTVYSITEKNFVAVVDTNFKYDRQASKDAILERKYTGGDLQIYKSIPVVGGISLRGEFSKGIQPCFASDVSSPKSNSTSSSPVYNREFLGWYALLLQNIDPIKSQVVVRYDVFDPNTKVTGDDIDAVEVKQADGTKKVTGNGKLTMADLQYSTIGAGWIYNLGENIKLTAYYDHVMNEKAGKGATGATNSLFRDDLKDDVFTFRIQYKF